MGRLGRRESASGRMAPRAAVRMGSDPVGRLLARFAVPVVAGLLVSRFYILVDGMFVGQALGSAGVAATAIAMPFVTLLNALVMLIGDGAPPWSPCAWAPASGRGRLLCWGTPW